VATSPAAAERSSFVVVVGDAQPMEHDNARGEQDEADYRGGIFYPAPLFPVP
jgi:hypothetical protein